VVHRIGYSFHYFLIYLFIYEVQSLLLPNQSNRNHIVTKEKKPSLISRTSNFCFSVTTISTTSLVPLSYSTASVSLPFSLPAANRHSRSTIFVSNGSPKWKLAMKFNTDGTELPAAEANSRSLCCSNNVRLQHFIQEVQFPFQ
jgi:hypothetical protein